MNRRMVWWSAAFTALCSSTATADTSFGDAPQRNLSPATLPLPDTDASAAHEFTGEERPCTPNDRVDQPSAAALARRAAAEVASSPSRRSIVEHLNELLALGRTDADVETFLANSADTALIDVAAAAEAAWREGRCKQAIELLARLEADGALAGLALNWRVPQESKLTGRGTDVRIGTDVSGAERMALDFDRETDNAYAIVAWGDMWTVERSHDLNSTWYEASRYITTGEIIDLDAAVVDEYLYVSYIDTAAGDYGDRFSRLRRCNVASGAQDFTYETHVLGDAGLNNHMEEVSICTNADEFDDRIYVFCLDSDGDIHYLYADETGWIFTDAGTPVTDASAGLDAAFGTFNTSHFLFVSYINSANDLHLLRRSDANAWNDQFVRDFSGYNQRTSISAWQQNVICAFEEYIVDEFGIRYVISYNSGDNWGYGTIADPDTGESFFAMADVTARGGTGTAVVYQQDIVTHDELFFRRRSGYSSGGWEDPVIVNDYYTRQDTWTTINWLPPTFDAPTPWAYGMLYVTTIDNCYFNREDGYVASPGDNCDEPLAFSVPGDLPYTSAESTCGRVDDYDQSAMGDYDNGEDIIYRMNVTAASTVTISVSAATNWAGVGVFSSAPPGAANCLAYAASYANPDVISDLHLSVGTYYIMIDTWPSPNCTDFTMSVTMEAQCPEDLDGDGYVGQSDLGVLLSAYGQNAGGDIDGDGDTDQADLGALLGLYNQPCP